METLQGTIQSIQGPYNKGWCIMRVSPGDTRVTGCLPASVKVGDVCEFTGAWKNHPTYGPQFVANQFKVNEPQDVAGMKRYLDRHLPGVGLAVANAMVEKFGEDLFSVMENNPGLLAGIKGVSKERALEIHKKYMEIKEGQAADLFFATHGITANMAARLEEQYGHRGVVCNILRSNPYKLINDVWGIGFAKADAIAMSVGIKKNDSFRLRAGARHCLIEASSEGHCFLPEIEMQRRATQALNIDAREIATVLPSAQEPEKNGMVYVPGRIYEEGLLEAENNVTASLKALLASYHSWTMHDLSKEDLMEMDGDQRKALEMALSSKVFVLTGGPGTGKTYTINKIIRAIGPDKKVRLAAPTGKAAKRMNEATGMDACTIHRLLEYSPFEGFRRDKLNPLECDVLIIDETSMVDISLMESLMDAVSEETQVIFVGDNDQLPSVGPGKVLGDMIASGAIPTAHLKHLHRQAAKSLINVNAQRINCGDQLTFDLPEGGNPDMWFLPEEDAKRIPEHIVTACRQIVTKFKIPLQGIQVLCPQKKGPVGTHALNKILGEQVFNPDGARVKGTSLREGDRVIQLKNNYDLGIFNGDIGVIRAQTGSSMIIAFEDYNGVTEIEYPIMNAEELAPAYALTIHKSQGSEFPVVIMPVHTTNYIMLKRNLLYTGITRGKKMVLLVGTMKAIGIAVNTLDSAVRFTSLAEKLKGRADIAGQDKGQMAYQIL